MYHQADFDNLIQGNCRIIQKVLFVNLFKTLWRHNYTIFQFLFWIEKVGGEG